MRAGDLEAGLEERRARVAPQCGCDCLCECQDVERKRKAAKSGSRSVFPVGARATFEILRILRQTRILGSFVNLLKRIFGGVQAYAEKFLLKTYT